MKVAIVHYWLVGMRGGEKVLESLCRLYPDADIYTHTYVASEISDRIRCHTIKTTFIHSLPMAPKYYKRYLPLMPLALEQLDLKSYDLIISSEAGPAKGIIPAPGAVHVCYCHSPMRYIWNMYHTYRQNAGFFTRLLMPILSHYMRIWDTTSSSRVDLFIANSETVATRIRRYYRRDAVVIPPPVAIGDFEIAPMQEIEDYYLMVGELVAYKRPDLAVETFNRSGKRLIVIGGGDLLNDLRKIAKSNVSILGPQPFSVLKHHYARCRGLIFPGEEDFGIVPVEVLASGRPVIAFGRGGATETVISMETGVFFAQQTEEALSAAILEAEHLVFDPSRLRASVEKFASARFERDIKMAVDDALRESRNDVRAIRARILGPA